MTQPQTTGTAVQVPAANGLAKALLINTTNGAAFPVMYNPEELVLAQGNTFAEIPVPGLNASPVQYIRGNARSLSMDLFFDSYETGQDVRTHTAPIVALLDVAPHTQAPPVLLFSMGRLQFQCVLTEAGQRFTMFLRDGTPVRSTLSVTLREYVRIDVATERGLFFLSPVASAAANAVGAAAAVAGIGTQTIHIVAGGDTLTALAALYLGDASRWREIAEANNLDDPLSLTTGRPLVIPTRAGGGPSSPGRGQP